MKQLNKLQNLQLMILKDIHDICVEHGLKYYLIGGTLIGAIRHEGFIPWDDDIDIAMYRDDLRALEELLKQRSDKYFVQNFKTDKNYTRYITKIRLNNTLQIEKGFENVKMHKGIFIDIFPLDYVDKKGGVGLELRGYALRLLFAYKTIRHVKEKHTSKLKSFFINVLHPFSFLIPSAVINFLFDYVCTMSNKKESLYTTSFASRYGWKKQLVDNRVYSDGQLKTFVDQQFYVPSDYEYLLRQLFGDYLKLPPQEKRTSGHEIVKIEFGPYQ